MQLEYLNFAVHLPYQKVWGGLKGVGNFCYLILEKQLYPGKQRKLSPEKFIMPYQKVWARAKGSWKFSFINFRGSGCIYPAKLSPEK